MGGCMGQQPSKDTHHIRVSQKVEEKAQPLEKKDPIQSELKND